MFLRRQRFAHAVRNLRPQSRRFIRLGGLVPQQAHTSLDKPRTAEIRYPEHQRARCANIREHTRKRRGLGVAHQGNQMTSVPSMRCLSFSS